MTTTYGIDDEFGSGGTGLAPGGAAGPAGGRLALRDILRAVLGSVWQPYANVTALEASVAANRGDGQLAVTLDTYTLWVWKAADTTAADGAHVTPTDVGDGAGRWVDLVASVLSADSEAASAAGEGLIARVCSTGNVSTASPGATIDGVSMAAGDIVFLAKQTTATQGGLWIWNGAAVAMTRPTNWNTGSVIPSGTVIQIGGEGTANANTPWKLTSAKCTVGTSSPVFYPRTVKGTTTLTGGAKTVSNLFILTGADARANDTTTAADAVATVITAGQGNGSLAFTGNSTDGVAYLATNW